MDEEAQDLNDQAWEIIKTVAMSHPIALDECVYCGSVEQDDGYIWHLDSCVVHRAQAFMEKVYARA